MLSAPPFRRISATMDKGVVVGRFVSQFVRVSMERFFSTTDKPHRTLIYYLAALLRTPIPWHLVLIKFKEPPCRNFLLCDKNAA